MDELNDAALQARSEKTSDKISENEEEGGREGYC